MSGKASPPTTSRGKTTAPASAHSTPAKTAESTSLQPSTKNGVPNQEVIRTRAFFLWEQAGYPESDGVEFWLRAEQELQTPR
jgi:hypothetical protein